MLYVIRTNIVSVARSRSRRNHLYDCWVVTAIVKIVYRYFHNVLSEYTNNRLALNQQFFHLAIIMVAPNIRQVGQDGGPQVRKETTTCVAAMTLL